MTVAVDWYLNYVVLILMVSLHRMPIQDPMEDYMVQIDYLNWMMVNCCHYFLLMHEGVTLMDDPNNDQKMRDVERLTPIERL